jgi:transcriptional regulator with XRE-family HTH domain
VPPDRCNDDSVSTRNSELSDFLRRARSRVDPSRAGLPADGRIRRVPGLRREEVALLAGVSSDYYARLEQGRPIAPSPTVVDAVAHALDLDEAGRTHLLHLLGSKTVARRSRPAAVPRVRPGLHQFLDDLEAQPALILSYRADVLASNRLARALLTDFDQIPASTRNYARWILLSPEARELFVDWDVQARTAVETLRLAHGAHPDDRALNDLIELLLDRSVEFGRWWSAHAVYQRTHGRKHLRHPVVGELVVDYETMLLPGDPDQTLFIFTTEPASPSRDALRLLASWTEPATSATQI